MRRAGAAALCLLAAALAPAAPAAARERWATSVLALVPPPGFPAHALVAPSGRVYEGTYDNPSGDRVPSRVLEYTADGTLLHGFTVYGQDLSGPHGVQAAATDARGRVVLLDKSPPRVLALDPGTRAIATYATFPAGAVPNYAAWGPDGSLYVTDYEHPVVYRVAPGGGGRATEWLRDARLDGGQFGATGIVLLADRRTLMIGA